MPTARAALVAIEVNNKIYAIGGVDCVGGCYRPLAVNEVYDPATNTWTTKAPMPTARFRISAATVNGKIYVFGGGTGAVSGSGNRFDVVEEYNPITDTWTTKNNLSTVRDMTAAAVVNNKIYLIGGNLSTLNEEYDPVTDTWTTKAPMLTGRRYPGAAVINNKIYVIGGFRHMTPNEEYDPITDTWTTKAPMPTGRYATGATAVVNNKIYVLGGYPNMANNEEYSN